MKRSTTMAGAVLVLLPLLPGLPGGPVSTAAAQSARTPAPSAPAVPAPAVPAAAPPVAARPAPVPVPVPAPVASRAAAPAEPRPADNAGEVIARIGTSELTAAEIRSTLALLDERQQAALARDPALLGQAVRAILANRLVLKEALAKKWEQQPRIAMQIDRARDTVIIETYLQSLTSPADDYPGEAEVKSVYDANAAAFLVPRRFKLAQIVVAVPKAADKPADKAAEEAARRKLDEVVRKVRQPGADFAALARSDSDDPEGAGQGGDLGWIAESELKPEIGRQVVGLAKAGVSDPVRLDDGWHIMKLVDTEAAHTRPFAEVREALVKRLRTERAEANRRALVADLLRQTPPAINEIALSKLLDAGAGPSGR